MIAWLAAVGGAILAALCVIGVEIIWINRRLSLLECDVSTLEDFKWRVTRVFIDDATEGDYE